jgi:hypothetical protein
LLWPRLLWRARPGHLAQPDPVAFLAHFDRNMVGYERLRGFVLQLSERDTGCSIEILKDTGDDHRRQIVLDWILELGGEHRRAKVRCTIERRGKHWIVTDLDPVDFFEPPPA